MPLWLCMALRITACRNSLFPVKRKRPHRHIPVILGYKVPSGIRTIREIFVRPCDMVLPPEFQQSPVSEYAQSARAGCVNQREGRGNPVGSWYSSTRTTWISFYVRSRLLKRMSLRRMPGPIRGWPWSSSYRVHCFHTACAPSMAPSTISSQAWCGSDRRTSQWCACLTPSFHLPKPIRALVSRRATASRRAASMIASHASSPTLSPTSR